MAVNVGFSDPEDDDMPTEQSAWSTQAVHGSSARPAPPTRPKVRPVKDLKKVKKKELSVDELEEEIYRLEEKKRMEEDKARRRAGAGVFGSEDYYPSPPVIDAEIPREPGRRRQQARGPYRAPPPQPADQWYAPQDGGVPWDYYPAHHPSHQGGQQYGQYGQFRGNMPDRPAQHDPYGYYARYPMAPEQHRPHQAEGYPNYQQQQQQQQNAKPKPPGKAKKDNIFYVDTKGVIHNSLPSRPEWW